MLEIEKDRTAVGNIIKIFKDNKALFISQDRNYDIQISLLDKNYPATFTVDITDNEFYYIIGTLYKDIKNTNNIYLFHNDIVDYHSDDAKYEYSSRFIVVKDDDKYNIIMTGSTSKNIGNLVHISKQKSRYSNDNDAFFNMYSKLNVCDYKNRKLKK